MSLFSGSSATFSRYIARTYLGHFIGLLLGLLLIVYLFDTVELIRRASKKDDIPLTLVMQMGLLKLPEVAQILLPFAVLFSAMFTLSRLTKRLELVVARAAGFSVWQFMAPIIGVAVFIGLLQITILNPFGSLLVGKFEQMENYYFKHQTSQIALLREGLWLRQDLGNTSEVGIGDKNEEGYVIIHAPKIIQPDWILRDPMIMFFGGQDEFLRRVNAKRAWIEGGNWIFEDALIFEFQKEPQKMPYFKLPTHLTTREVEESFASPSTMSFWSLPGHIETLEETGFDAVRLKVHYQNILSQPLMFAAMVLLAAAVSMRPPRAGRALGFIATGIFVGFVIFFMSSFLQALGASRQIPVPLAAWSPAMISFLFGLGVLMNLEDG